ncbi:MAG: hypothetical protein JNM88_00880 [Chitinophagaceae bacterium]|nr:hypothetical protein [Chitinophagaceae bacterium]
MGEEIKNILKDGKEYNFLIPVKQAQRTIIAIWFMGIINITVAVVYIFQPDAETSKKLNQFATTPGSSGRVHSIDELLIAQDETAMADKKAFVNGALRFQWRNPDPDLSEDNNRNLIYNNILKKKLQRLPRAANPDFSIRPVPQ